MLAWGARVTTATRHPGTAIRVVRLSSPSDLAGYEIHTGLGAFSRYGRRREEIVRESLGKTLRIAGGEAFVAASGDVIVGYLLLVPSGPDQPWGRLNDPRVLEVGIEVARGHRSQGLARELLGRAFLRSEAESRIYVAAAYAWCWDIEDTGLDAEQYAGRLLGLFERFGFRGEWTNEPNVAMDPSNFLAVRVGQEVPAGLLRRFRQALRGELAA
jgi:GNAT superfamily N-acetyltransferase